MTDGGGRGVLGRRAVLAVASCLGLIGCSDDDDPSGWTYGGLDAGCDADGSVDGDSAGGDADAPDVVDGAKDGQWHPDAPFPCPQDMVLVEATCIDRFEAPNREGALPLVMFHFDEASSWCAARGKRLCFDDEWTRVCGGAPGYAYPYGDDHDPGICTDDKVWVSYDQEILNAWPWTIDTDFIESFEALLETARLTSAEAAAAADHIAWLYQAEPSGSKPGCTTGDGAFDLSGNVEEWTQRRIGGSDGFHGNLKGRYWAETRACQESILSHGDLFRFYEIGFRCCRDPQ